VATELNRSGSQVTYRIVARLDRETSASNLTGNLAVVTNDPESPEIQVPVVGAVRDRISASLFLGIVAPGQKATKQIVVRGKELFRVTGATCEGPDFKVAAPDATVEKSFHLLLVTFVAPKESGRVEATIHIETSLGAVTPIPVYANVVVH
jgi:hypothetical protein